MLCITEFNDAPRALALIEAARLPASSALTVQTAA
jgi:hypothetical protein